MEAEHAQKAGGGVPCPKRWTLKVFNIGHEIHAASIPKAAGYHSLWKIEEPQLRSARAWRNGGSGGSGLRRQSAEWSEAGRRIQPRRKIQDK
jgi:hypothetical protein